MLAPHLRQHPENKPSILLSQEENEHIYALLGSKCITIATAVVQLFHTKTPDHSYWNKQEVGVLCFVKDNTRKNYFFRLYCLRRSGKVWEHEVYKNMDYRCPKSYFHLFEGDKCIYAFNFASASEAEQVKYVVVGKLDALKTRAAQKEQSIKVAEILPHVKRKPSETNSKNKKHRKKLTKEDIGKPTEFRHITKVQFDCTKGLDVNTTDEVYREIFRKAGVKDEMLQHPKERDFLYDFVDKCRSSIAADPVSHAPTRSAPKPPQSRTPPPPPARKIQSPKPPQHKIINQPQSQPPNFAPPPPPPPPRPPSLFIPNANIAAPPPPPPPPVPPTQINLVQNSANPSPATDARSALLESIRQGPALKSVSQQSESSEPDRDDMLKQIKGGISLKPAADRELKSPRTSVHEVNDIAMALKKALETINTAVRSDDDTSSETSTDDEWDC